VSPTASSYSQLGRKTPITSTSSSAYGAI
jgi:hypothetical protein